MATLDKYLRIKSRFQPPPPEQVKRTKEILLEILRAKEHLDRIAEREAAAEKRRVTLEWGEIMSVSEEYERIKKLFEQSAPEQVELLDGVILEAARIKEQLDRIAEQVEAAGGLVRCNPKNPAQQKVLPAAKELPKLRASYINTMRFLSRALGAVDNDEDNPLADYE